LRNPTPYGEWSRHRNRVPRADYDAAITRMSITPEQVDGWVKSYKDAGFGYVIFVAKHHDGLAFWPSHVSSYTFQNLSKCPTDVCGEMRKACDRHGLKLAFYYSQWQDWEHPDGWGNFWDSAVKPSAAEWRDWHDAQYSGASVTPGLTPERFARYWDEKCVPQVKELLENYHPDLLWFDCYIPRGRSIMSAEQVGGLLQLIRRQAPDCLVNSRLGIATIGGPDGVDFETLGDNEFGAQPLPHPWETAATLNRSWGYNRDDEQWKSAGFFLRMAVHNIGLGGNLAVNIGPKPDGSLPADAAARLAELGRVISPQINGFRGCGPAKLEPQAQDWGAAVAAGNRLFLHVFEWPVDGIIRVTGLNNRATAAKVLATGGNISISQAGPTLHLAGPRQAPVPWDTVIEVTLDGPPVITAGLTGEINGGGWHLGPATATVEHATAEPGDKFWLPAHLTGFDQPGAVASWRVAFPAAGVYHLKICQACPETAASGVLELLLDGQPWAQLPLRGTAPDASEFRTFEQPAVTVASPGLHVISLHAPQPVAKDLRVAWLFLSRQP
jgi:alpha-L-fucosidase